MTWIKPSPHASLPPSVRDNRLPPPRAVELHAINSGLAAMEALGSAGRLSPHKRRDKRPFLICQVAGIAKAATLRGSAMFRLPHGALPHESSAYNRITTDSPDSTTFRIGSKIPGTVSAGALSFASNLVSDAFGDDDTPLPDTTTSVGVLWWPAGIAQYNFPREIEVCLSCAMRDTPGISFTTDQTVRDGLSPLMEPSTQPATKHKFMVMIGRPQVRNRLKSLGLAVC